MKPSVELNKAWWEEFKHTGTRQAFAGCSNLGGAAKHQQQDQNSSDLDKLEKQPGMSNLAWTARNDYIETAQVRDREHRDMQLSAEKDLGHIVCHRPPISQQCCVILSDCYICYMLYMLDVMLQKDSRLYLISYSEILTSVVYEYPR